MLMWYVRCGGRDGSRDGDGDGDGFTVMVLYSFSFRVLSFFFFYGVLMGCGILGGGLYGLLVH